MRSRDICECQFYSDRIDEGEIDFSFIARYKFRGILGGRYLLPKMRRAFRAKRFAVGLLRFSATSGSPRWSFCISVQRFSRESDITFARPFADRYRSLLFPFYFLIEIYITSTAGKESPQMRLGSCKSFL